MSFIDTGGRFPRFLTRAQKWAITNESAPRSSKKWLSTDTRSTRRTPASTSAKMLSAPVVAAPGRSAITVDSSITVVSAMPRCDSPSTPWSSWDLACEIAKGNMQHQRVVLEERGIGNVGRRSNSREKDQITGPHKLCDVGNNRDRAVLLKAARCVSEFLTLERRPVVQPYFLDRP